MSRASPVAMTAVLPGLVRQHVENAAHFWGIWRAACDADGPESVEALRWRQMLEAHLDGAQLAGAFGRALALDLAEEFLAAGEVFVAARLVLQADDAPGLARVVSAVGAAPEGAPGLASAVATAPVDRLTPHVRRWLNARDWPLRIAGMAACGRHAADPGVHLATLLADPVAAVRTAAAHLAGALGRGDAVALLRPLLDDPAPEVRFAAASVLAATAEGRKAAAEVLRALAAARDVEPSLAERALDWAVAASAPEELRDWVRSLWSAPATAALAVRAAGVNWDAGSWPWLIECMQAPGTAAAATGAAEDMLGLEAAEGALFTADPRRLGPALAALTDGGADPLADPAAFARALADGRLTPDADPEDLSQRARGLRRLRAQLSAG